MFDAEVFAICQALETFEARNEEGTQYTVFSGFTASLTRAMSDRIGPWQAFARATTEVADRLVARGCSHATMNTSP